MKLSLAPKRYTQLYNFDEAPYFGERAHRRSTPMRVLLVDDNVLLLTADSLRAEDLRCEVVTATSGVEACALLKAEEGKFGAIITDMQMPDGTGLSILEYQRDHSLSIPTLLHSGDDFYCHEGNIVPLHEAVAQFPFAIYASKASPNHIERFLHSLQNHLTVAAE